MSDTRPEPFFEVRGIPGIPEVRPGDDLAELLIKALNDVPISRNDDAPPLGTTAPPTLRDGDIIVVTSKIVSKAEGRMVAGMDRDDAIDAETVRTVSEWTTPRGRTRIVETKHGFVMAAAGVDASNVAPGTVVLLPEDPDASARRLRDSLRERLGVNVGVILTDTAGRVWRNGVIDMAIGSAGVQAVDDLRGMSDPYGNDLGVTVVAVADELASASELVRTKLSGVPVAVIRGLSHLLLPEAATEDPGASVLVRPSADDRFRLGTPESMRAAVLARRTVRSFTPDPVDPAALRRAVEAALTAPYPSPGGHPARFVVVESSYARAALADLFAASDETFSDDDVAMLRSAPCVVVPCAAASEPGTGTLLAVGAAVENLLVALAADGLGSAWLFPSSALTKASEALSLPTGWTPAGAIAIGHPAGHAPEHAPPAVDEHTVTR
jgi:coenzyme F420-0:L-glutamate ligase/coenzyme F420-1:gamma-L-glutamate ligase